ncbi:hypothetical protein CR513_56873, partial [Mucuna pruriens]
MSESCSSSAEEVWDDSREESVGRDSANKDLEQLASLKLNQVTRKDHFPLPFIDQVLEKYMQIHIALVDQHKTTFTCPYGAFTYTRMSLGLCNAPSTF